MWRAIVSTLCIALCGCEAPPPQPAPGGTPRSGVVMLRYNPGSESTEQRERGFLETLAKKYPHIKVLSSDQYAGTTPESSLQKSEFMLQKYGDQVAGVFCVCEPNAMGMLAALEQAGLTGAVKFVGFDPSPKMVEALAERKMQGIVLQDPVQMGYLAVKTLAAHLNGEPVKKRIPTGEYIATPENMKSPEMKRLLSPEQYQPTAEDSPTKAKHRRLAVVPKGTTHEFWKSVHAGAVKAARELGDVEIIWKGPLQENDREGQIDVVQNLVVAKVDGICLAPLDARALVSAVAEAKQQGIPTVIFDSGLEDERDIVSYVATDNYHGGVLAAERLAEVLQASAK